MHLLEFAIIFVLIRSLDSTLSKSDARKKKSTISAAAPPCETLVTERGLVTQKPGYKEILQNHMAYSLPHVKIKQFPLPTLAYVTPANPDGYEHAKVFKHKLSHVSPAWLYLSPAKTDTGFAVTGEDLIPQDWIRDLRSPSAKRPIVPRMIFEGWSSQDFNSLFTNQYVASGCSQAIVRHLVKHRFDGVSLDVWSMLMGHRKQDLVHFARHLGRELRASGLIFVLLVPPPLVNSRTKSSLFDRPDFDSLFDSVDFFSLQPFDFAAAAAASAVAADGAVPVSPIGWLRACVEALAPTLDAADAAGALVRRAKLLLPVTFYGCDHVAGSPEVLDARAYLALLKRHRPDLAWSPLHQEHFATYSTGIGIHTMSYPTLASLKSRINLAKSLGTGIAIWDIGQGLEYFFDLL